MKSSTSQIKCIVAHNLPHVARTFWNRHYSPWLWTIAFRVSPVIENAFVWLKITAPSDLLLDVVCLTNVLTYLLTIQTLFSNCTVFTVRLHVMQCTVLVCKTFLSICLSNAWIVTKLSHRKLSHIPTPHEGHLSRFSDKKNGLLGWPLLPEILR